MMPSPKPAHMARQNNFSTISRCGLCGLIVLSLLFPSFAEAWNEQTHMVIAYVAYRRLSRHTRDRVDEVLVLHPLYSQWTKGAKTGQAGLIAFLHAAAWPDCIQNSLECPGYVADGSDHGLEPSVGQESWQNIGFSDRLMHRYWHFIQMPYAAETESSGRVPSPNISTQLKILMDSLNSNAGDALKSYDLAWVENLIGELHQPLNCVSRFSAKHPNGDQNARDVRVEMSGSSANLHAYWDNLLAAEEDIQSAIKQGKTLAAVGTGDVWWDDEIDIDKWINDSVELAKKSIYTTAVISADDSGKTFVPDDAYRQAAIQIATKQAVLAGNRLATVLNKDFQ